MMKDRLVNIWDAMSMGLWFVPTLLTLFGVALSFIMPAIDREIARQLMAAIGWVPMTAGTAQAILAAIAGAMVTVAGVVFSITIVTLSIASSQLGPRLLRTFMGNSTTHFALGIFLGTSLYSFLVLSEVRGGNGHEFVPHFSVFLAVIFAVLSLAYLIYYIHQTAMLIQAPNVVSAVAKDLDESIDRLFPEEYGSPPKPPLLEADIEKATEELKKDGHIIQAQKEGYLQTVDMKEMLALAEKHDLVVHLCYRPGRFIIRDTALVRLWPPEHYKKDMERSINGMFAVGNRPTPRQDVECAVNEIVEVGARALSPGLNDPFTAINCLDRLTASLIRLAKRKMPSAYRHDSNNNLRIIVDPVKFGDVLNAAFNRIREYSQDNVSVSRHILEGLALIAPHLHGDEEREALLRQGDFTLEGVRNKNPSAPEMEELVAQYNEIVIILRENRDHP